MEQNEIISKLIDDVIDGNNSDASAAFKDVVTIKVSNSLDQRKQELAQKIFNQDAKEKEEE